VELVEPAELPALDDEPDEPEEDFASEDEDEDDEDDSEAAFEDDVAGVLLDEEPRLSLR
jgi:hypothetical protein